MVSVLGTTALLVFVGSVLKTFLINKSESLLKLNVACLLIVVTASCTILAVNVAPVPPLINWPVPSRDFSSCAGPSARAVPVNITAPSLTYQIAAKVPVTGDPAEALAKTKSPYAPPAEAKDLLWLVTVPSTSVFQPA